MVLIFENFTNYFTVSFIGNWRKPLDFYVNWWHNLRTRVGQYAIMPFFNRGENGGKRLKRR